MTHNRSIDGMNRSRWYVLMQQEFSKTFQKCISYVTPKLLHRKNSLSMQYRRYNSRKSIYFLKYVVSIKNSKERWISAVWSAKRDLRPIWVYWVSGVRATRKIVREHFFRHSTFRIAGRENLAARRRDLLDACRAVLRDLLPTLARFKSQSRTVFAKFITSHWDFSTTVDAAKSLLWKVHSKRRFTRSGAENLSRQPPSAAYV